MHSFRLRLGLLGILSLSLLVLGGCRGPKSSSSLVEGEGSSLHYYDEPQTAGGPMTNEKYR